MSSLELQVCNLKHICHTIYNRLALLDSLYRVEVVWLLCLVEEMQRERLLKVNPALHVVGHCQILGLRLTFHMVAVKVTARHKDELVSEDPLLLEPGMRLAQCFGEKDTGVDLVLGDACQLGAERRELWVNLGSHIGLELAHNCLLTDVDEHDGELNDLL